MAPLLAEPLCYAVSLSLWSVHLYLCRLPAAGGPGSPELALKELEAQGTPPGAACSMSQESYDTTQKDICGVKNAKPQTAKPKTKTAKAKIFKIRKPLSPKPLSPKPPTIASALGGFCLF